MNSGRVERRRQPDGLRKFSGPIRQSSPCSDSLHQSYAGTFISVSPAPGLPVATPSPPASSSKSDHSHAARSAKPYSNMPACPPPSPAQRPPRKKSRYKQHRNRHPPKIANNIHHPLLKKPVAHPFRGEAFQSPTTAFDKGHASKQPAPIFRPANTCDPLRPEGLSYIPVNVYGHRPRTS